MEENGNNTLLKEEAIFDPKVAQAKAALERAVCVRDIMSRRLVLEWRRVLREAACVQRKAA